MAKNYYRLTDDHTIRDPETGKPVTLKAGSVVVPDERLLAGIPDRLESIAKGEKFDHKSVFEFGTYWHPPIEDEDGAPEEESDTDSKWGLMDDARCAIEEAGGINKMKKAEIGEWVEAFDIEVTEGTGANGGVMKRDLAAALSNVVGL